MIEWFHLPSASLHAESGMLSADGMETVNFILARLRALLTGSVLIVIVVVAMHHDTLFLFIET